MNKPTKKDCIGCRDDFYNHNRMGLNESSGEPCCWHLSTATLVDAMDIPVDLRPPYLHVRIVKRPSCYKRKGEVRVKKEALAKDGYWK